MIAHMKDLSFGMREKRAGAHLVVDRRRRACQVIDLIHLQQNWLDNIVPYELEVLSATLSDMVSTLEHAHVLLQQKWASYKTAGRNRSLVHQVFDVVLRPGKEVIETDHVVAALDEGRAKMRPDKAWSLQTKISMMFSAPIPDKIIGSIAFNSNSPALK